MNLKASTGIVMEAFDAVERRDARRLVPLQATFARSTMRRSRSS
jgi:hypothetical protein